MHFVGWKKVYLKLERTWTVSNIESRISCTQWHERDGSPRFFRPESIANVQGICEGSGETIADQ